jgi:uncharacterized protein (DUF924 family)
VPSSPQEVLDFWFGPEDDPEYGKFRPAWFQKDEDFDREIRERFGDTYESAAAGELDGWREGAESCLALIIVLDQFSRNMFRGDGRTHAADGKALETARYAVDNALDRELPPFQRHFVYMPYMHSENLEDQRRSETLFEGLRQDGGPDLMEYAVGHREIVERFGRFPHRNAILDRETTPEEAAFLEGPNSSY